MLNTYRDILDDPGGGAGEGDAGAQGPGTYLRRGGEAARGSPPSTSSGRACRRTGRRSRRRVSWRSSGANRGPSGTADPRASPHSNEKAVPRPPGGPARRPRCRTAPGGGRSIPRSPPPGRPNHPRIRDRRTVRTARPSRWQRFHHGDRRGGGAGPWTSCADRPHASSAPRDPLTTGLPRLDGRRPAARRHGYPWRDQPPTSGPAVDRPRKTNPPSANAARDQDGANGLVIGEGSDVTTNGSSPLEVDPSRSTRNAPRPVTPSSTRKGLSAPSGSCCSRCGEDPDREGLRETPARVARAYRELFAGLYSDPDNVLDTHVRREPRGDDPGPDIPIFSPLRAPPAAVPRQGPRRLHPERAGQGDGTVEAGAAGRPVRQAAAGTGAAHHPGRRRVEP